MSKDSDLFGNQLAFAQEACASMHFLLPPHPACLYQTRSIAHLDGQVIELCLSCLLQRALRVVVVRDGLEVWNAALEAVCNLRGQEYTHLAGICCNDDVAWPAVFCSAEHVDGTCTSPLFHRRSAGLTEDDGIDDGDGPNGDLTRRAEGCIDDDRYKGIVQPCK